MKLLKNISFSCAGIALMSLAVFVRKPLAADYSKMKTFEHTYALPNAAQLQVFSLGYRSALADLIFADTLVRAGMYFKERTIFRNVADYLGAIVELEPRYRDVYVYGDALLTLSTVEMPLENYRKARTLLEKGLKVYPDDVELWTSTGRFMVYIAVPRLPEGEDVDEWKARGAEILEHACYLGIGTTEGTSSECFSSSRILKKIGKNQAAITNLKRLLAINDDPAIRAEAYSKLQQLLGKEIQLAQERQAKKKREMHLFDIPLLPSAIYELLGPASESTDCAGIELVTLKCASSFATWESLSEL